MTSPTPLLVDTYYHIYNRGVNRENIFVEARNYDLFINLYLKHISPIAETFAYCLLRNHFHLLVRIKSADEIVSSFKETLKVYPAKQPLGSPRILAQQVMVEPGKPLGSGVASKHFSDFFNAYAKTINKAYGRTGSLFQHPFGRVPVTNDAQFWNALAYIHQNPQKHKFVDDFRDWKYSSYGLVLSKKGSLLQRDVILDWFGGEEQYLQLHESWVTENKWFAEDDDD